MFSEVQNKGIGVPFSKREDEWEFRILFLKAWDGQHYKKTYRYYGKLPDGNNYGCISLWDKYSEEKEVYMVIVNPFREIQSQQCIFDWPSKLTAAPDGSCIVWFTKEKRLLLVSKVEIEEDLYWCLLSLDYRFDYREIRDVIIDKNSFMHVLFTDGSIAGYCCKANAVLSPWENGCIPSKQYIPWDKEWVPSNQEETERFIDALEDGSLDEIPESVVFIPNIENK